METISTQLHVVCTMQEHKASDYSEQQIEAVQNERTASENYLMKIRARLLEQAAKESPRDKGDSPSPSENTISDGRKTTIAIHGDTSMEAALKGFHVFDGSEIDTPNYLARRSIYDSVRSKYPDLRTMPREDKVKALRELKRVGFTYYTIKVTVFVKIEGKTQAVTSKSHHRLERVGKAELQRILESTFGASLRPVGADATQDASSDTLADVSTKI